MKQLFKDIFLVIFYFLILNSCSRNSIEQRLCEKGNLWFIFKENSNEAEYENINYGYTFFDNGKLDYKIFDFSLNKPHSFKMDDLKQVLTWEFIEPNSIRIEHKIYKILKFDEDTLRLKFVDSDKTRLLINLRNKNPRVLKIYSSK